MSSRLTRLTGITAGTLLSGGLLLGGAAPAFADNNNNTNSATVTVSAPNSQSQSATISQAATATGNSATVSAPSASGSTNVAVAGVASNIASIEQKQKNKFSFRLSQHGGSG